MYHYVYELTSNKDGRKYIGVRSCKCPISNDTYMSSCKVESKDYINNCTKQILQTFATREQAVAYEIYLHELYDVGINPLYFNGAKQTATKFDQSGRIYSSFNPNAKIINVYDHLGTLRYTFNGTLTTTTMDIPKNAFSKSFKTGGVPIGLSAQSRIELRKRMHQNYIGWYALLEGATQTTNFTVDFDIQHEQSLGLFSPIPSDGTGASNPNAKIIIAYNPDNTVLFTSIGTFAETLKKYGIPKAIAEKAKRLNQPINTNRVKHKHLNGIYFKLTGET